MSVLHTQAFTNSKFVVPMVALCIYFLEDSFSKSLPIVKQIEINLYDSQTFGFSPFFKTQVTRPSKEHLEYIAEKYKPEIIVTNTA